MAFAEEISAPLPLTTPGLIPRPRFRHRRHADSAVIPPSVAELMTGMWHVGTGYVGHFPYLESRCACEKTVCGLVRPMPDVVCEHHFGDRTLRQAHRVDDCEHLRRLLRRGR